MRKIKREALEQIKCLEKWAQQRYIEDVEWEYIISTLTESEFQDLNTAYKIVHGCDYPIQPK